MAHRFAGRSALITGSTNGIGKATAIAMAAEGAHVIVTGRDAERGKSVVSEITDAGGRADFVAVDLAGGQAAVDTLVDQANALTGGRVDVLVNNAAVKSSSPEAEKDIDTMLAVNVKAHYLLTNALAPAMAERGGGAVIYLGSIAAKIGLPQSVIYTATTVMKHALARSAAAQYGPSGVRVNIVAPGAVANEDVLPYLDQIEATLVDKPSKRATTPQEVAAAIMFLVSDDAANIHGAELFVDGGHTAV